MSKVTLSVIKADVGGYVGHSSMHPALIAEAEKHLGAARAKGQLTDFRVMHCGDDLELIMLHTLGPGHEQIHQLAWDTFVATSAAATKLHLYGAGQDLLSDSFSGNLRGMGPGIAELMFEPRRSEPILVFMADKTSPGAWNLPLYKAFADPFNTAGLVIDPALHDGFKFQILDVQANTTLTFACPDELYDLLVFIGSPSRYVVKAVFRRTDDEPAAAASVERLGYMAGRYVGKDDPVMIVRTQSGFPAVGEVLEAFALPHLVEGWMRGSHVGPLMPVAFEDAQPTRFDGPPRVIAAGFQLSASGLMGPRDMFKDPSFDETRRLANRIGDYMRRLGPFEPHRLPLHEMEYTTLPQVMQRLQDRFETVEAAG